MARFTIVLLFVACGCRSEPRSVGTVEGLPPASRGGDEIAVLGKLYPTGTRVVLWDETRGYNAYQRTRHFDPEQIGPRDQPHRVQRYGVRKSLVEAIVDRVEKTGWNLKDLRQTVRQVVIHYDACGTSKQCFKVLHDIRGLSCHFLLDLDGTLYQTLDVQERAWHAAQANDRSVGIEIAHPGAFSSVAALDAWYVDEGGRRRLQLPPHLGDGGLPDGFIAVPARQKPIEGVINGRRLYQYDFTDAQYTTLVQLLRALRQVFPGIAADVPRDAAGNIRHEAFASNAELFGFSGILAHYHVTTRKHDPGPAFDWTRVLAELSEPAE